MGGQEMFPFPFQGQGTWPICIYVVLNFVVNHMTDWVQEEVIGTRSWRTIFHGVPGAEKTQTLKWLRQFFETVCEWTHPQEFVYLSPQNTQAALIAGMCVLCFAVVVHIVAYNITTMQEFFSVPGTVPRHRSCEGSWDRNRNFEGGPTVTQWERRFWVARLYVGPPATVAFKYVLFPCILGENDLNLTNPRCSMYGYLPTYIYHTFKPNVGKYTIHSAHMGIIY